MIHANTHLVEILGLLLADDRFCSAAGPAAAAAETPCERFDRDRNRLRKGADAAGRSSADRRLADPKSPRRAVGTENVRVSEPAHPRALRSCRRKTRGFTTGAAEAPPNWFCRSGGTGWPSAVEVVARVERGRCEELEQAAVKRVRASPVATLISADALPPNSAAYIDF